MTTQHHQVVTKILDSAAIVLGAAVGLAAPAGADTNAGADPNPFSNVSCSCQTPASVTSLGVTDQLNQGIHDGLTTEPSRSPY